MKTPDEIKKGLECCECCSCPWHAQDEGCLWDDYFALSYIQQLEADKDELLEKIEQLKRERDAALRDTAIICETCLYNKPKYDGFKVRNECHNPEGCHYAAGLLCGWVWRGVCEENGGAEK